MPTVVTVDNLQEVLLDSGAPDGPADAAIATVPAGARLPLAGATVVVLVRP